jgi:hypothetical protein
MVVSTTVIGIILVIVGVGSYTFLTEHYSKPNIIKPSGPEPNIINPSITNKITLDQPLVSNEKPINMEYKIAFVNNTFTNAAYNHAFYDFYNKYDAVVENVEIRTDLNNLTGTPPDLHTANDAHLYDWISILKDRAQGLLRNSTMSIIKDEDIHNGKIFDPSGNASNSYDVLVIGHMEYATQKMYDNLKKFVSNGGVIMFMDGNIFYAEVSFNPVHDSVTLVKGHSWVYNGIYAKRSMNERWANETTSWLGSNYYQDWADISPNGTLIYKYKNDPFGYEPIRNEDQYVTNPDIHVILDYKLTNPTKKVITYWKSYGTGKVIVLGIYSEEVVDNPAFLKFYDTLILDYALKK